MGVILTKQPHEVSFTGNPMPFVFTITPYGFVQSKQNYKLQVNVLVELFAGSNIYETAYSELMFPDATGAIAIDVRTILDAYLEFYTPKLTLEKPVEAALQRRQYRLTFMLFLDDDIVYDLDTTAVFFAVKGGLSYEEWNPFNFFQQNVLSSKMPLHFPAETEKVTLTQKLFFSWLYPYLNNSVQTVTYTFTFDDGTTATYNHPKTIQSANKWCVCIVPAGLSQLDYTIPTGKTVVKYSIQVKNALNVVIATSSYYTIDYRPAYDTYTILYRNSLGGLASACLRGEVDAEADYSYQQATRINPASYFSNQILLAQVIQQPNTETEKFTGDTGFRSKAALVVLRDLFLSVERYEISPENKLLPVVLNSNNVKLFTNKDSLFSLQVQWQRAYENSYFTPAGTVPASTSCPAVDIFNVAQVNKNTLQIIWGLVMPYDRIRVTINNGTTTETYTYTGNYGSVLQSFDNLATDDPVDIIVTAQTLCDEDADPVVAGAVTTLTLSVKPNSNPIAVDNTYNINSGFSSPVMLSGNVMDNDYDPDGDDIEATAATGSTHAGGTYTLNTDGTVSYQPPSTGYTGQDYFQYKVHELLDPSNESNLAKVYINVGGSSFVRVYARLVLLNQVLHTTGPSYNITGDYYLKYYSDTAASTPLDITGLGLTFNVQKTIHYSDTGTTDTFNLTFNGSGLQNLVYSGIIFNYVSSVPYSIKNTFTLQPGTGYTVIS